MKSIKKSNKKSRPKAKKETYYKCIKCGDEIYWNTQKKYVACKCGALAVDGCEFYVRIIGDEKDYKSIKKEFYVSTENKEKTK